MVADEKWDEQVLTKKETVSHDGNVWNPTDVVEAESTTKNRKATGPSGYPIRNLATLYSDQGIFLLTNFI